MWWVGLQRHGLTAKELVAIDDELSGESHPAVSEATRGVRRRPAAVPASGVRWENKMEGWWEASE